MNLKINRHARILDLISRYEIGTQEELADYLNKDGFVVTQATISRDIRQLHLTKIPTEKGRQRYVALETQKADSLMDEKYLRVLKAGYVSMDSAGNILVIKTVSGMAMAVAAALDAMNWPQIAGCIAGDDTIFCAIHSLGDTPVVMDKIRGICTGRDGEEGSGAGERAQG